MIAARKGTEPGLQTHSGPSHPTHSLWCGLWAVTPKFHLSQASRFLLSGTGFPACRLFRLSIAGSRELAGIHSALNLQPNRSQVVNGIDY
jgi:hypothetical protein